MWRGHVVVPAVLPTSIAAQPTESYKTVCGSVCPPQRLNVYDLLKRAVLISVFDAVCVHMELVS
jgi:hypothetical protein